MLRLVNEEVTGNKKLLEGDLENFHQLVVVQEWSHLVHFPPFIDQFSNFQT